MCQWAWNGWRADTETFILAVDGTDFQMWEVKHPTLPIDRSQCSHKFKHGAVKYEIAISTYSSKICWISGPHTGGKHDLTIFREGLKQKIAPGKRSTPIVGTIQTLQTSRCSQRPTLWTGRDCEISSPVVDSD
jgi:hypothetical protein